MSARQKDSERVVILGLTAAPMSLRGLCAHLRVRQDEPPYTPLFRSNRGIHLSYSALRYEWSQFCITTCLADDTNKPCYTIHQLRHTRATELDEQGQHMEIVQRGLGHPAPRLTQGYVKLNEMHVQVAVEEQRT